MAKLNPNLVISITKDLNELHKIGIEMLSYVDKCDIASWKYPDRLIKDIEMEVDDGIFDTFDKYILLLELIIDRLYFIINLSVTILESLPQLLEVFRLPKNVARSNGLSFGSLVAFFWKRLLTLAKLQAEEINIDHVPTTASLTSSQSSDLQSNAICESCYSAMIMIKTLISKIEACLRDIKLNSEIGRQRPIIEKSIFTISQLSAMQQWTNSIVEDVKNIIEFSKKKSKENANMALEIENQEKKIGKSSDVIYVLQRKYEDLEQTSKEGELKIQSLLLSNNELQTKNTGSEIIINKYEENIENLQKELYQVQTTGERALLDFKIELSKELDRINTEKYQILDEYDKSKKEMRELEHKLNIEQTKQKAIELKLQENEIDKKRMEDDKFKLTKQNLLLIENLRSMTSQLHQEQEEFMGKSLVKEKQLKELEDELKLCKDRENTLARCPDLNGAIIYNTNAKKNPLMDMEQQFTANSIRIELLSEQNRNLQRTIEKMRVLQKM